MISVSSQIKTQVFTVPTAIQYFPKVVDLNNDGYDDLVLAGTLWIDQPFSTGPQPGYILLNDKAGGFTVAGGDPFYSYHPRDVSIGDFNGDQRDDIFIVDHGYDAAPFPGYTNHLLLNAGNGNYTNASHLLPQTWDFSHSTAAGDINGDGRADLYVGNIRGEGSVNPYLLINGGGGELTLNLDALPQSIATGMDDWTGRTSLTALFHDVNGDGALDLIVGPDGGAGLATVFYNDGAGRFSDAWKMDLPRNEQGGGVFTLAQDIEAGDLNGDGIEDLVVVSTQQDYMGWSVQLLIGKGDGTYADETAARLGSNHFNLSESWITFISLTDASRNGTLDIVFQGGGQVEVNAPAILFNDGNGYFKSLTEAALSTKSQMFNQWMDIPLNTPEGLQFVRVINQNGTMVVNSVSEIVGADENWTSIGTPRNDSLNGTSGVDRIFGQDGNDVLVGSAGNDILNGGLGTDAVRYGSSRSDFTVKLATDGTISVTKPTGNDKLVSIERIAFTDGALLFDLDSDNAAAAYRLYGGAFDRTPDEGGLLFWTDYLDNGGTLTAAAAGFVASAEFNSLYGSGLSDAQFVDQLYLNVLGRPGEADGVAFWNDYLVGGDRAVALVQFTQLAEYVGLSQADIVNGYWVLPA
jgi:Ca2+-binding RTX toxin-like protein